jgi:hypothetical protein
VDDCQPLVQGCHLGRAVQVDPIKPKLKAPGTKHLKLKCDMLLSTFAVKFNLRQYTWDTDKGKWRAVCKVGRCRLKPADTQVESEMISFMPEPPCAPLFTHSDKYCRPPMHHSALETYARNCFNFWSQLQLAPQQQGAETGIPRHGGGRGFHSSTLNLNVSAFCGTRGVQGVFRRCLGGV